MKYADDTVLYVSGKTATDRNEKLNSDLSKLDKWFSESKLIINLSKGKAEALLFGTSKRVAKESAYYRLHVNDRDIEDNRELHIPRSSNRQHFRYEHIILTSATKMRCLD